MADKKRLVPGRYAVVAKDTGKVAVIKNMQGGVEPELDEFQKEKYDVVNVSMEVEPGMTRKGSGFEWAEGEAPPGVIENPPEQNRFARTGDRKLEKPDTGIRAPAAPKAMTERQRALQSSTEPRTVRKHPTRTGMPEGTSNKEPGPKTRKVAAARKAPAAKARKRG